MDRDMIGVVVVFAIVALAYGFIGYHIGYDDAQTDTETKQHNSVSVSSPSMSHVLHGARHSCRSLLERLNQMQLPKANGDSAAVIFQRNGESYFDARR